ncbi:glycosyltransferase family 4 protein [Halorussus sp. MSC15.2]|uniref:glycosyltransferase family 4 protein n=1 Tax=Halorussus sp. MSC15.2 TaxID=2283638 RepID=UPI0013CF655B|nr:glycosyltransferase family 4 protein [Halorussus sp. MSC15.2]NEU56559.1 glycosyltransferase family 4 protein [Halorussus sp. MSC15.2]
MRVAVLSDGYPPWDRGGAQRIAAQLAEGYDERGHEVAVVTAVENRADAGRATTNGVAVRKLWSPKPRSVLPYLTLHNPFVVRRIGRVLDAFDPDAVHAHNVHYLSNAGLRAAAERAPVVETYHDAGTVSYGELTGYLDDPPAGDRPIPAEEYRVSPRRQFRREGLRYNPVRNPANRRTRRRHVEYGVAVSDALRTALRANGVPCHETIRNGVDAAAVAEAGYPAAFRADYGLGDAPVALFGGRTGYNKGGAHLARAFAEVLADVPDARLVVTGDDEYVSRMREIAESETKGARNRIVTTGWLDRDELCGALRAATVVATPSVHLDPFPTLNLEAFAAGTPVVTSRFGGADELVADGEDGFVVNPFEVSALADALRRLLADRETATRFGQRGRRKVRREFTVGRQVESYLRVLRSAAGRDADSGTETTVSVRD